MQPHPHARAQNFRSIDSKVAKFTLTPHPFTPDRRMRIKTISRRNLLGIGAGAAAALAACGTSGPGGAAGGPGSAGYWFVSGQPNEGVMNSRPGPASRAIALAARV
jgi:hypothetical protein